MGQTKESSDYTLAVVQAYAPALAQGTMAKAPA